MAFCIVLLVLIQVANVAANKDAAVVGRALQDVGIGVHVLIIFLITMKFIQNALRHALKRLLLICKAFVQRQ